MRRPGVLSFYMSFISLFIGEEAVAALGSATHAVGRAQTAEVLYFIPITRLDTTLPSCLDIFVLPFFYLDDILACEKKKHRSAHTSQVWRHMASKKPSEFKYLLFIGTLYSKINNLF